MIFYFSGTGNSQWVAKQLADFLDDELISINDQLKKEEEANYQSKRPMVFVLPTYAWRMPKVVEKWIRAGQFKGNQNAYFVLTCGGAVGNAEKYAKKLCKNKGIRFCGLAEIRMPENYIALFSVPTLEESQEIIAAAEPIITQLAHDIQQSENFPKTTLTFKDSVLSGPVNGLFYPLVVNDKGFTVSDACISCGKCVKRCPVNNISLINGKPQWKGNCTHCMACIACCPTVAIEYDSRWGTGSKGKRRYDIFTTHP